MLISLTPFMIVKKLYLVGWPFLPGSQLSKKKKKKRHDKTGMPDPEISWLLITAATLGCPVNMLVHFARTLFQSVL